MAKNIWGVSLKMMKSTCHALEKEGVCWYNDGKNLNDL